MDGTIISSDELKTWIEKMRQNYAVKMAKERVMMKYDSNNDGVVSMEEYFDLVYENDGNLGILSDPCLTEIGIFCPLSQQVTASLLSAS